MQVYSQSQKKIIEIPDAPVAPEPQVAPEPSFGEKIGTGAINLAKGIVKPFVETGKNIATAAVMLPQAKETEAWQKIANTPWANALFEKLGINASDIAENIGNANILGTRNRAEDIAADPEKAIRQQVGNSAQIASWAVPYGKAGFVGSKFIVPGAVQGALSSGGRTLSQEETSLPEVLGNTLVGAGVGAGTGAILQGLGWVYGKVANKLSGAGAKTNEAITNANPKATDINYIKDQQEMNAVADKYLGTGTARDKLTKLPEALDNVDKTIKTALKGAEKVPVDTSKIGENFLDDFMKNSSVGANDPKFTQAWEQLQARLDTLGTKATPTSVYNLKSELSGELAPVFKKIANGSPLSAIEEAKISLWGALKDGIDTISPEISLLNSDQHILMTLPSGLVKSMTKAGASVPIPGMIKNVKLPISNETSQAFQSGAGKFLSETGDVMSKVKEALPPIIGQAVPKASVALTTGGVGRTPQAGNLPPVTPTETIQPEPTYITGYSPEQLYQGIMKAQQAGDSASVAQLRQMYNDELANQKLNPTNSKAIVNTNARDADVLLKSIKAQLINPDGTVNRGQVLESAVSPMGHKYEADMNSLLIKFIQSQTSTGRLPTKESFAMYKKTYMPNALDSDEAIKAKIENMENAIENAKYVKPTADVLPDITEQ